MPIIVITTRNLRSDISPKQIALVKEFSENILQLCSYLYTKAQGPSSSQYLLNSQKLLDLINSENDIPTLFEMYQRVVSILNYSCRIYTKTGRQKQFDQLTKGWIVQHADLFNRITLLEKEI